MKINYNQWFYEFNNYIHGHRGYNDDSWIDIGKRYKNLIELNSQLMKEQPFGVVGNRTGFDKLINLVTKSNYRFNEIDDALLKTYEQSLRSSMSGMVVNTHSVIFHANNLNDPNISNQNFTSFYIVDVPYDQMHFGERDEFIRQKLNKMHDSVNDQYISMDEFLSDKFTDLLGFSIICTINGLICNDLHIGFDDHGLKFKFRYGGVADAEIIIYKLDNTTVRKFSVNKSDMDMGYLNINLDADGHDGQHCIVDIYHKDYTSQVQVVPNFGYVENRHVKIDKVQKGTYYMINQFGDDLDVYIYFPKYMNEVKGIYPMANYFNIARVGAIYTDLGNDVKNRDGKAIVGSDELTRYSKLDIPKCTPPICIDREYDTYFDDLIRCVNIRSTLNGFESIMIDITNVIESDRVRTYEDYVKLIKDPILNIYGDILRMYRSYINAAYITSIIEDDTLIKRFTRLLDSLDYLASLDESNYMNYMDYVDDYILMPAYSYLVDELSNPYDERRDLEPFRDIFDIIENFQHETKFNTHHYNRPVSEQCLISLKWSRDYGSWVFAYPEIKRFRGIENTFYINNASDNAVFKFFVLYTDTFYTSASVIDDTFTINEVLDYDEFIKQTQDHLGFIRYWDVENQLMRLSKLLYNKYDDEHVVHVLSDILCHRLDVKDLLNTDWSNIKYSRANITSDNYNDYDEMSDRAPLTINFLFYTMALLNNDPDQLQAYFYHRLTDEKFDERYMDYNVSAATEDNYKLPYNFSYYYDSSYFNNLISAQGSNPNMDGKRHLYYGAGTIFQSTNVGDQNAYQFSFHQYNRNNDDESFIKYPLVTDNVGYDDTYYIIPNGQLTPISYYYDIKLAKLITRYLTCVYTCISHIETNYHGKYNIKYIVDNCIIDLTKIHNDIIEFFNNIPEGAVHHISDEFKEKLIDKDKFLSVDGMSLPFLTWLSNIYTQLTYLLIDNGTQIFKPSDLISSVISSNKIRINYIANWFLRTLRKIYFITGYKTRTIQRVRGVYLYFKKFNKAQTPYSFRQLHRSFDASFIAYDIASSASSWDSSLPDKKQPFDSNSEIPRLARAGKEFVKGIEIHMYILSEYYRALLKLESIKTGYVYDLSDYVRKVVNEYTFDLYVIDQVIPKIPDGQDIDDTIILARKPAYIRWQVARDENHPQFTPPSDSIAYPDEGLRSLYFAPKFYKNELGYYITLHDFVIKTCEYTFFNRTTISSDDPNTVFEFFDENGNSLYSLRCTVTFRRVGNTADLTNDIELMLNGCHTTVDIQNVHEDDIITSEEKQEAVQIKKTTNTNYEMLMSNRYIQLDHFYEKIATFKSNLQGPVDRIYMNNQDINQFVLSDIGDKPTSQLFFKPVQIMHGSNIPVGTGLTIGQKIYLMTTDELHYVFPAYVTKGTHTRTKGFVEAEVDSRHSKWFEIKDKELIQKYLNNNVECVILDDNYSNFYDEFNNTNYTSYNNPVYDSDLEYEDEDYNELYSTLGDPVYVQNNAKYVYTRLNHFLNPLVENRFIDEEHKLYRFIFLGSYDMMWKIYDNVFGIVMQMVSRDMNSLTKPEMYPILRDEPNDHDVKLIEYYTYKHAIEDLENNELDNIIKRIGELYKRLPSKDVTPTEREAIHNELDELFIKASMCNSKIKRISDYMNEPEKPTRWFNVPYYEDSEMYVNSNRTSLPKTFKVNVADLLCYEKCEVWLYDWEHKHWIDPSTYTVVRNHVDDGNLDVDGDYTETSVLMSLSVLPKYGSGVERSKKVLVYIGYKTSDLYDNIDPLTTTCDVKFKPILSTDNTTPDNPDEVNKDAYKNLKIRKNIDLYETYNFKEIDGQVQFNTPEDFRGGKAFYIKRPELHNGSKLYVHPTFNDLTSNIDNYEVYTRLQLNDVKTDRPLQEPTYTSSVIQEIDNFTPREKVKLICISTVQADYNGNISTVMFEGSTGYGIDSVQTITITKSSLPDLQYGSFLCTVFHDVKYKSTGGIVRVTVVSNYETVVDSGGSWVRIPNRYLPYQEIPNEFLIVPNSEVSGDCQFVIDMSYKKKIDDIIHKNSSGINNPFEFYYDFRNKIRYPISNTRRNKHDERLTYVDPESANMEGIQVVKTNHLHVCRYSLANIPTDGIIDVTGYIPTPLSRRRYEWWVNGKQLIGNDNLIITSPTSFQLINLRSLKNFELVELVDDMYDSIMTNLSNVYIDLEGNTYTSYQAAFKSNKDVVYQSINFSFNGYPNHNQYQNSTTAFMRNPNNIDIEDDIMDKWVDNTEAEDHNYNNFYNTPTINGVEVYHPFSDDLGLREVPNIEILDQLDKTWKLERMTNNQFPTTHYDDSMIEDDQYLLFHIKETDTSFVIYTTGTYRKYFTLYMSKGQYSSIESAANTVKVIPFVRTGVRIELDKSIRGLWLHATNGNYIPKKIQ